MKFVHLLITRFNLNFDENCTRHLDAVWLDTRFQIFEKYCLPSVQKQSNQNFTWLVLLDENTPKPFIEQMENHKLTCSNLEIVLLPPCNNMNTKYAELGEKYKTNSELLVTTRLDNDDAISNDFIANIQDSLENINTPYVLTYPIGLQYFDKKQTLLRVKFVHNHFVTLVEQTSSSVRTILGFDHREADKFATIKQLEKKTPMWLEVVHGNNIINNFTPHIYPTICTTSDTMGFPISLENSHNLQFLVQSHIKYATRFLKKRIKKFWHRLF